MTLYIHLTYLYNKFEQLLKVMCWFTATWSTNFCLHLVSDICLWTAQVMELSLLWISYIQLWIRCGTRCLHGSFSHFRLPCITCSSVAQEDFKWYGNTQRVCYWANELSWNEHCSMFVVVFAKQNNVCIILGMVGQKLLAHLSLL